MLALVLLLLKVRSSPEVKVDAAKLAQAEQQYERTTSSATPIMDRMGAGGDRPDARQVGFGSAAPTPREPPPEPAAPPPGEPALPVTGSAMPSESPPASPGGDDFHLEARMSEANQLYDRGDFLTAEEAALEVLAKHPNNIRMLRIVVSTSCATDNAAKAREYAAKLPSRDQRQMARRCGNWGVTLDDGLGQ